MNQVVNVWVGDLTRSTLLEDELADNLLLDGTATSLCNFDEKEKLTEAQIHEGLHHQLSYGKRSS